MFSYKNEADLNNAAQVVLQRFPGIETSIDDIDISVDNLIKEFQENITQKDKLDKKESALMEKLTPSLLNEIQPLPEFLEEIVNLISEKNTQYTKALETLRQGIKIVSECIKMSEAYSLCLKEITEKTQTADFHQVISQRLPGIETSIDDIKNISLDNLIKEFQENNTQKGKLDKKESALMEKLTPSLLNEIQPLPEFSEETINLISQKNTQHIKALETIRQSMKIISECMKVDKTCGSCLKEMTRRAEAKIHTEEKGYLAKRIEAIISKKNSEEPRSTIKPSF